jgi:hypothetical protein
VDKTHVFRLVNRSDYEGDHTHGIFSSLGLAVQVASGIFSSGDEREYDQTSTLLIFEYEMDKIGNSIACYDRTGNLVNRIG